MAGALAELSEAPGVSGAEDAVRRIVAERAHGFLRPGDRLETDALGNVIVTRRPPGADDGGWPTVMVAAHMDEAGLVITAIEPDGSLRFRTAGGIDRRVLPGRAVAIGPQRIPGVIGAKPIHLQKPDERRRAEEIAALSIDIGAESREEAEKAVKLGDWAVFATGFSPLGQRVVAGRALDDRVGCAALLEILAREHPVALAGVFTVQEELGSRGAAVAAYRVKPRLALVLEGTVCAEMPGGEPHEEVTRMGGGAALSVMDRTSIADPRLVAALASIAKERGIPYQWRRTTAGGNDAGPIHVSREGVPSASVSAPCRYIHGPMALADLRDVEAVVRLVDAFLEELPRRPELMAVASWHEKGERTKRP